MYVVSAAPDDPSAPMSPEAADGLRYGVPVTFRGNSGFFHPAGGAVGVVLCSPWGFEDLTMRKSWRLLAEALSAAGHPCLRFDYPGTGNSLGRGSDVSSCDSWVEAIHHAAACLRLKSGVKRFVFLGQSLGAALAVAAARSRSDVVGLQLIAPVVKGRAYARELAATAALVAQRLGIAHQPSDEEALNVVGFPLSRAMVDSLKRLDLSDLQGVAGLHVTIFDQDDRKAAAELCGTLRRAEAVVAMEPIAPYHLLISDATTIQPLPVDAARVVAALGGGCRAAPLARVDDGHRPAILSTAAFREEALRFGADDALFGVLCRPARAPRPTAPAVVLLNRGLNPHLGWRRVSVEHARALAAAGIASLRFDLAGLGESRDEPGRPANLIYSDLLLPDIGAAVGVLARRGFERVALAGVCSGAYMALVAARHDPRVTEVFAVNPQRFVWNPAERPEDVIRYGLRSMNDYVGDVRSAGALKKLFRSRRRILPAMHYLLKRSLKHAMAGIPLGLRSTLMPGSMAARVHAAFRTLAEHGTRVHLLFTPGDPGLLELRNFYGREGRHMRHPNVGVAVIADADHNLTATRASDAMLAQLLAFAEAGAPRDDGSQLASPCGATASRTAPSTKSSQRAVCPT